MKMEFYWSRNVGRGAVLGDLRGNGCGRAVACVVIALGIGVRASAQMHVPTSGRVPDGQITRSLLLGDDLEQVRAWWAEPVDPMQQLWKDTISRRADRDPGGVPGSFSESVSHAAVAQCAAFRWAMTGAQADLDKAVGALLDARIVGATEITETEIAVNYLQAYDFIRAAPMDGQTRGAIEAILLGFARDIGDWRIWQQENNILAKRAATRALAGVLLRDQDLLDSGLSRLNQSFNKTTTDDGWYTDGPGHYLNYILPHLIPFVRAYEQGSGINLWSNVRPFSDFSLALRLPNGRIPNVQDGLYYHVPAFMFSRGLDDAGAASTIWQLQNGPDGNTGDFGNVLNNDYTYLDFFYSADFSRGSALPEGSPTFISAGQSKVTVFRQDWSGDSDYMLLSAGIDAKRHATGFRLGHNHNDTGEFLVFTHGEPVLTASGLERRDLENSPPNFFSQRATEHNVVLIDGDIDSGDDQRPEDFVHTDRLDTVELGDFRGVCDFATLRFGHNGADLRRSAAFPNEDYFVIADWIDGGSTQNYDFNLIGRGVLTVGVNTPDINQVSWEIGEAQVVETLVGTHPLSLGVDSTWMHYTFNNFEPTGRMRSRSVAQTAGFLSVIEPGQAGDVAHLIVTDYSTTDVAAVGVDRDDGAFRDVVVSQGASVPRSVAGLGTDAVFGYARWEGDVLTGSLIVRGSTLSEDGEGVLTATRPVTLSLSYAAGRLAGTISGDGFTPDTQIGFRRISDITVAQIDGRDVPFENGADVKTVTLPEPGVLSVYMRPGCDDIKKIRAKCQPNGTIKGKVKLRSAAFDGSRVRVGIDDSTEEEVPIRGKKARLAICCFGGGEAHTVRVVEPSGCRRIETEVGCP